MKTDFQLAEWLVRPSLNRLERGDEQRRISPKAMELLQALAQRPGEVLSKDDLIEQVWADGFPSDEALTTVIYELRRALGDSARQPRFVATIRKRGYRLVAEPVAVPLPDATPRHKALGADSDASTRPRWRVPFVTVAAVAATALIALILAVAWYGQPWSELPELEPVAMSKATDEQELARQLMARLHSELDLGPLLADWQNAAAPASSSALADAVIEGSVQRQGNTLKIDVQLQDALTGRVLWGGSYELLDQGSSELQIELAREIRQQVEAFFAHPRVDRGPLAPTRVAEAFERGQLYLDRGTGDDHDRARTWFHLAVHLDSSFTPARDGLATSYVASAWEHYVEERYVEALDELAVARQLQPTDLAASLLTGDVLLASGRSVEALLACQRVLELAGDDQAQIEALAEVYQVSGIEGVLRCLVERDRQPRSEVLDPTWLAALAARLGDAEVAFEWLELAYREQRLDPLRFAIDPSFDALRDTERYRDFAVRLALEA